MKFIRAKFSTDTSGFYITPMFAVGNNKGERNIPFCPIDIYFGNHTYMASSEEEFLSILKSIFHSEKTKQIINALMSQMETT